MEALTRNTIQLRKLLSWFGKVSHSILITMAHLESRSVMSVGVVLLQPESLIDGEPPSRIAGRGNMLQAPESCWRRCCRDDVGRGVMSLPSHPQTEAIPPYLQ
jgi:hypothetical protein